MPMRGGVTHARALAALIFGSALLAFGPALVRVAGVAPGASAFWRMALAAPVLAVVAVLAHRPQPGRALPWGMIALAAAFFAADLLSWHAGIVRTTNANATLFANATAFMLAGWVVFRARRAPDRVTGISLGLAVAGTALLLGLSAQLSARHALGDALSLLAAAFYTGYLLVIARVRAALPPLLVAALVTPACALWLALALPFAQGPIVPVHWWPVAALALVSQVFGQGLLIAASGRLPHTVMGMGLLVQPVIAAAVGWAAFGEALGPAEFVGMALVLAALGLITRAPAAKVAP